jgi:beta-phosphoglucomutase-like phosphatase (HAD superfamily)
MGQDPRESLLVDIGSRPSHASDSPFSALHEARTPRLRAGTHTRLPQSKLTRAARAGLAAVCAELAAAGRTQAAVSNACGAYVRAVVHTNGVAEHFAVQLGADEVPAPKPAPDGLLMCCSTLAVDPTLVRARPSFHDDFF